MLPLKAFIYKYRRWEFWHSYIVYSIPSIYFVFLSIRARSWGFFSAANPNIANGGFGMESKYDIYQTIPKEYSPITIFFAANTTLAQVMTQVSNAAISFPFIIKPDIGFQGKRVEKINNENELGKYLANVHFNFIVQELIQYPHEMGVFYCRYPSQQEGFITGIVYKEYPSVIGDGIHTIAELIKHDMRLYIQSHLFNIERAPYKNLVLPVGEHFYLSKIGNHARGTKFLDISHLITPVLSKQMDTICKNIPLFYFGRLDIKYNSLEELAAGKNFSIIELNGAASLPTYMYDPKHSLLFAWKEMIKHFRLLYKISVENRKSGHHFLSFNQVINFVKEHIDYMKVIKNTNNR